MSTIPALIRQAWSHWNDAAVLTRTGVELHERNRLDLSREVLERSLELDGAQPEAWEHRAFTHIRDRDPGRGFEILREGIDRTGSDSIKAQLAAFTPDEEERSRLVGELESNDAPRIVASLVALRRRFGDDDALDELKAIQRAHADDPEIRMMLLWSFLNMRWAGNTGFDVREEAVPLADAAIAATPDRVMGYWMRAQLLLAQQAWKELRTACEETMAQFPDEETGMCLLGQAHRELGNRDEAIECFSRAIGMKPSFVGARTELARLYEKEGDVERAERLLREAVTANPRFLGAPINLAALLARAERWEEAEAITIETWNRMQPWEQGRARMQPAVTALLERDNVKAALA